jgi:glutathione S-transferase
MSLVFYHGHGSPYSWRVWLALEHLGVPYELKVLSFADKDTEKPEFVAINPRHQVPTITDEGFALWESTVILEYLDERTRDPNPARRLYPGDIRERARIRRIVREVEAYLGVEGIDPIVEEFFYKEEGKQDAQCIEKARTRVAEELNGLQAQLRGPFLAGDAPTAADYVLYPYFGYVNRITFRKPAARLTELVPPAIAAWGKRIESLAFFDKTFPPHWK